MRSSPIVRTVFVAVKQHLNKKFSQWYFPFASLHRTVNSTIVSTAVITSSTTNWTPLIVGLALGMLAVLLVLAYVTYRRYRHNRWKKFQNDHINQDDIPDPDPSYPVTHKYFRGIRGHPSIHSYEATDQGKTTTMPGDEKPLKT